MFLTRQNYTYDAVGELTALSHANPLQNQSYQYDKVGNRTRQSSPAGGTADYRYDPDSQQLLGTVMGAPATGQQLNHFRSDARGAIDRSQTELKLAFWNVFKAIRCATIGCRRQGAPFATGAARRWLCTAYAERSTFRVERPWR
uniref:hypothetical protein n=1 Tax=Methylomonas koyamae TaxID=702114 RepID=UPI0035C1222F